MALSRGVGTRRTVSCTPGAPLAPLTPVIPDFASMRFYVRAQSAKGVKALMAKVEDIFEAAGKATGCKVKIDKERMMYDLKNNLQMAVSQSLIGSQAYGCRTSSRPP